MGYRKCPELERCMRDLLVVVVVVVVTGRQHHTHVHVFFFLFPLCPHGTSAFFMLDIIPLWKHTHLPFPLSLFFLFFLLIYVYIYSCSLVYANSPFARQWPAIMCRCFIYIRVMRRPHSSVRSKITKWKKKKKNVKYFFYLFQFICVDTN